MHRSRVRHLYKHCSFNERTISSLLKGHIWFPTADTFNDQFDCNIVELSRWVTAELRKRNKLPPPLRLVRESGIQVESPTTKAEEQDKELERWLAALSSKYQTAIYRAGVLCLSEAPTSILMWSHFGAQHKGICLEFERSTKNLLGTVAKPVNYTPNRNENDGDFYKKHVGWKYERE
jgi:hypothetical protein